MSLVVSQHPDGSGAALYLSGIRELERACAEKCITHVVSACKHGIAKRYAAAVGADTLNCGMDDDGSTPIEPLLKLTSCIEWIGNALKSGGRVLVHCSMGINRSPTLLIAFLLHSGVSLRQAGTLLHYTRPQADPLDAYWVQLEELEMRQRSTSRSSLSRDEIPSTMWVLRHDHPDNEIDERIEALERRWADATASVGGIEHVILGTREKLSVYWAPEVGAKSVSENQRRDVGSESVGEDSDESGVASDNCDEVWGSIPVAADRCTRPVSSVSTPHERGHQHVMIASVDDECCSKRCQVS